MARPSILLFLGSLLVLPNVIAWLPVVSFSAFFPGWVNFEFAALGLLYLLWPSRLVLAALGIEILFDLFEPVALTYYFGAADAMEALQYVSLVPWRQLLTYGASVSLYAGVLIGAIRWSSRRLSQKRLVCGIGAALMGLSAFYQLSLMKRAFDVTTATNVGRKPLRTPLVTIFRRVAHYRKKNGLEPTLNLDSAVANTWRLHGREITSLRPNVALIVVESWGELLDKDSREAIVQPYRSEGIASRYEIETGLVPFRGATVNGESRELCGKIFVHGLASAGAEQLAACLPNRLREEGYDTLGIHGFSPRMYERVHWYPRVGFGRSLFAPDLALKGMHTCPGGLAGTCDGEIAELVRSELKTAAPNRPKFVHWVSLNSHLAIVATPERVAAAQCTAKPAPLQDEALCVWSYLIEQVHRSVVSIASEAALNPTVFIVVGDHAPPFISVGRRALFSQRQVPYIVLMPKIRGER